jgi:hypothetical protein
MANKAWRITPCFLANGLWYLSNLSESLAFRLAWRKVANTQQKLLLRLLHCNRDTEFGRRYDFASIRSVTEYQVRVPLSTYEEYQDAIREIGEGQPCILTQDPVLLLEPTSGSTAATKHIPYTAALKAEFQRAISPWMVNLFSHYPSLFMGQAYWSVTPITRQDKRERTPGGISLGFEEDSEYFGGWQRHLIQAVLAVPPLVRLIDDMETFRYVTLLFLLRSRSLALISIWNPTFLTLLVNRLPDWWPQLATDIAKGTLTPPTPLAPNLHRQFTTLNQPDHRRAAEIQTIFQTDNDPAAIHTRLWPRLRLISCWTEAQAALYVPELARLFPQAHIQGKGLIATEGFVSLPLVGQEGATLAVRSHFFEFLPVDDNVQRSTFNIDLSMVPRLAHELELGNHYAVVITTGGGLYRYQLHDLVQVVGYLGTCPLLRFVGKEAYVSDWFGEKLNERHVQRALAELLTRHAIQPAFAMVACDEQAGNPGATHFQSSTHLSSSFAYTLFIEAPAVTDDILRQVGCELETALQENYHYRYCRELGQLDALRVFRIDNDALATYLTVCQTHGQRAGDIKLVALHRLGGWSQVFQGQMVGLETKC